MKLKRFLCLLLVVLLAVPFSVLTVCADEEAAPAADVYNGTPATSLTKIDNNTFSIDNAGQLAFFLTSIAAGIDYEGQTILLKTDIVWNSGDASTWNSDVAPETLNEWIHTGFKEFKGTLDGEGHTISGIYFKATYTEGDAVKDLKIPVGFLGTVNKGTIKNLTISDSYMEGKYLGGFVGVGTDVTISDCCINATLLGKQFVAGFMAYGSGVISRCVSMGHYKNTIPGTQGYTAGILGVATIKENWLMPGWSKALTDEEKAQKPEYASGHYKNTDGNIRAFRIGTMLKVEDCLNLATLEVTTKDQNNLTIGGIVAANQATEQTMEINTCLNLGSVDTLETNPRHPGSGAGPLIGRVNTNVMCMLNDCFYLKDENFTYFAGLVEGMTLGTPKEVTAASITGAAAFDTLEAFDFENAWAALEGETVTLKMLALKAGKTPLEKTPAVVDPPVVTDGPNVTEEQPNVTGEQPNVTGEQPNVTDKPGAAGTDEPSVPTEKETTAGTPTGTEKPADQGDKGGCASALGASLGLIFVICTGVAAVAGKRSAR